jgi:hypothetical protein
MTQQHEPAGELLVADRALKNQGQSWVLANFVLVYFRKLPAGILQNFDKNIKILNVSLQQKKFRRQVLPPSSEKHGFCLRE